MAKTNYSPTFPALFGDAAAVTPSDTALFIPSTIYMGGAGSLKVTTAEGSDVTFVGALAGTTLPVRCTRVWSTGLTAASIVRIF